MNHSSSSDIQVMDIFPTPIMKVEKVLPDTVLRTLVNGANNRSTEKNAKSDLLSHTQVVNPEAETAYRDICDRVRPRLAEFGGLLFGEDLPWLVKELWINVMETGGHQAIHSHANSFISGIIYLTPYHPSSRTVFYKGLGGSDYTFSNHNPEARMGPYNAPKWAIPEMAPGDMVLFPSYLLHEVPKNLGESRMSLALNAIPARLKSWDYQINFS